MSEHGMKSRFGALPTETRLSNTSVDEEDGDVLVASSQLRIDFQPIVSIRTGSTWGVEALARAKDPETDKTIPPLVLFAEAERTGQLAAFDAFCRRHAIERFAKSAKTHDVVLTLNWDTRTLGASSSDPRHFMRMVEHFAIPPERVVIEVLEGRAPDLDALVRFVEGLRREKFLIAVDDYGTGHSTAERLVRIEPDIVKIDRALVHGVASSVPRAEACRSIAELARSIGAVVIAEGVERNADLVELAMMGVDLFQGFLLARPKPEITLGMDEAELSVAANRLLLRERAQSELDRRRAMRRRHERVVGMVVERLRRSTSGNLELAAADTLDSVTGLEALYVLDEYGTQLTSTWIGHETPRKNGFRPTSRGTDLALKDYFLEALDESGSYATRPYVSMASGRVCVTHSRRAKLRDGTVVIVCCDLPSGTSGSAGG